MRNLKRALSLALAAIMVLGLMVVGASAASYEDFTDKGEIKNTEAVNTMVSLGVISGKDDGSYDPTGSLTRAEACTLIARMLGGGKDPILGSNIKSNFKDTQGHWAENYIAYCANLGIIAGVGDGNFKPDDTLTGSAAAKMVLCALGYKPEFEGIGGANWELATNTLATKVKLYDGLDSLNPSATITRDDVAQLIYNGVQAQEVEYRNLQGDYSGTLYATENGTMLSNRFGVVKVEGKVLANDTLAVAGSTVQQDGKARIESYNVFMQNNQYVAHTDTYTVDVPNNMVGTRVVIYVKFQNALAPNAVGSVVIGQPISSDKNTIVETASRLKDADAVKSALREAGIAMPTSGSVTAIQYTAGNVTNNDATGVQATAGVSQRFIDNDGDGIVDLLIQETPALAKVTTVNTSGEKITFSGSIGAQDFADVVGYEDLAKGDYVLVVKYDDGKYHVAKANTAEAEVTAYTPGTVPSITAGDTKYVMGAGANLTGDAQTTFNNTLIGNTYTLYLDNNGNILAHKLVESAVSNYAVVLGTSSSGNAQMGYSAKVKVLQADGTEATYDVDLANTAVKLGLALASATTSAKENAAMAATYFGDAEGDGTGLMNHVFGYSVDEDGLITLSNPNKVNTAYNTATFDAVASNGLKKSTASYPISNLTDKYQGGASTVLADDSTVFFLKNSDNSYSVVNGLSNLPASGLTSNAGETIFYVAPGTTTKVAKAVWATITTNYASSSSYAYISGGLTETTSGGTPIYTYPVVFEDGTVGTLSSKSANGVKNTVMKYTLDSKGYATLETVAETLVSSRVDYVNGNSVSLVNKDTNAAYRSVVINSNTKVWNVTDTANVYAGELNVNDVVAIVMDTTDGTVKTAFVYDTMLGDMTAVVGEALTNGASGDATVALTGITSAEATDTVKVTYTATANQKVTITIDGAGTDVTNTDVVGTGAQASSSEYALVAGDIGHNLTVTVKVTENNKDTRTTTYTVSVAA